MKRWGKCLVVVLALVLAMAAHASAKDALSFGLTGVAKLNPNLETRTVIVPLTLNNTMDLAAIDLPLKFGEPGDGIELLEVSFDEGRAHYFDLKVANIDNDNKTVLIGLLWMAYNADQRELATGEGTLATLTFEVTDPELQAITIEPTVFENPSHQVSFIYNDYNGSELVGVKSFEPELLGLTIDLTSAASAAPNVPDAFAVAQNYPNPFNASTMIRFGLSEPGNVRLDVFNILGQRVTTLKNEYMPAGWHAVAWNANDVASGVYFYRVVTERDTETRKMTLLK